MMRTLALRPASDCFLDRVLASQPSATARAVNIPHGDPFGAILRELGCPAIMSQLEMRLELGSRGE